MYVTCTWRLGMASTGRTDATGHFTPQTGTSPSRVNSVKPRTGRENIYIEMLNIETHKHNEITGINTVEQLLELEKLMEIQKLMMI